MLQRIYNIFIEAMLGMVVSYLLYVVLFEHDIWFFILPIFPAIGLITGGLVGFFRRKKSMKLWVALATFTFIFSLSLAVLKGKGALLRMRREEIALSIVAHRDPNAHIKEMSYVHGNGLDTHSEVRIVVSNTAPDNNLKNPESDSFVATAIKTLSHSQWHDDEYAVYKMSDEKKEPGTSIIIVEFRK